MYEEREKFLEKQIEVLDFPTSLPQFQVLVSPTTTDYLHLNGTLNGMTKT